MQNQAGPEAPTRGARLRRAGGERTRTVFRHGLTTRVWHWTNAAVLVVMLMSGLMIFNAHPRLYWGKSGADPDPAWLEIGSSADEGFVLIGGLRIKTTGVLGLSRGEDGERRHVAFPGWATLPRDYSLADSRHWHTTFAWLFALGTFGYLAWSVASRHLSRDLMPTRAEAAPRHVWTEIARHAQLRFPEGEAARRYNVLQKLSYLAVLAGLLPTMVLTGLAMSPAVTAAWPWLLALFGGRQSARSIHFVCAALLVLFVTVHLLMVLLAGPVNEIRSMITGRYRLPEEKRRWRAS